MLVLGAIVCPEGNSGLPLFSGEGVLLNYHTGGREKKVVERESYTKVEPGQEAKFS